MGEKITKMDRQPIISAKDVEITFSLRGKKLNAIRKCSLDLYDGETLAIVGESGSGKSVFTKTFVGMLDVNGKITGGSIMYEGRDMTKFTEKDWLGVRGKKIAMVMQDPMTSLNPLKKIGKQIQESIEHHQGLKGAEAKKAAIETGILERFYNPFIKHMLRSISLNSLSKWEARNYPTVRDNWFKAQRLAEREAFTFAALMTLYGPNSGFEPDDTREFVDYIRANWDSADMEATIAKIVKESGIFTVDFSEVPGFIGTVAGYVRDIETLGMKDALKKFLGA